MENEIIEEVSIEEIFTSDSEAIKWLNSIKNPNFQNILNILNKYAEECLKKLSKKDLSEGLDYKDKKKIIGYVRKYLSKQKEFKEKCLIKSTDDGEKEEQEEFKLELFTEEEIKWIQNLTDEDIEKLLSETIEKNQNEENIISKIRKANRFYNMQLKLSHTARIVRVAEEALKQFEGNLNTDLKEIVLISALLHDIGRFYQSQEYDDFNDNRLVIDEERGIKGHSKAGYYYSMMDLFRMNFWGDMADKDLLIRTIAGFVISYHGEPNSKLEKDGVQVNQDALNEIISSDFLNEEGKEIETLNALIKKAYSNAEFIQFDESFEKQKEFIKKFMFQMMLEKGAEAFESLSFDEEHIDKIAANLFEELEKNFVKRLNIAFSTPKDTEQQDENIKELSQYLSEVISKRTDMQFELGNIQEVLTNMANYDVAKSIYAMFKEGATEEEQRMLGALFAFPTTIVTDADKVDILNQLASGTYPINYNPSTYRAFDENDNFIEIEKEEAFKHFFSGNYEREVVLLKGDKENFYKYDGLVKTDNISPLRSALWLINQFIFTNMKNKGSLVLIKDNKFIENIYKQFSEDETVKEILKPYMAYTLHFLDYIAEKENNSYTPDTMQQFCEEAHGIYIENDKLREEYERMLEDNLKENMIITSQEIGKATIGVPTIAKRAVEVAELSENSQNKTNEGEKVGDDN